MRRLTTLFPSEFLDVVERNKKAQMPALVWSFVFGFAAGFRRSYNTTANETLKKHVSYREHSSRWLAQSLSKHLEQY
jgi:hypothetical protein